MEATNSFCDVCGCGAVHKDVADCMRDLMNYITPEIRETTKFQKALKAGYDAMKKELETE